MQTLTYNEAYSKIIEAYFRDEIKISEPEFCFCGTLNMNYGDYWCGFNYKRNGIYYTGNELQKMEEALLITINNHLTVADIYINKIDEIMYDPDYETALFSGMSAALDVLKQIHKERGEDVDGDIPVFSKRNLKQQRSFSETVSL